MKNERHQHEAEFTGDRPPGFGRMFALLGASWRGRPATAHPPPRLRKLKPPGSSHSSSSIRPPGMCCLPMYT